MNPRIETSVEAFAALMARLDDPFVDRATVLAASGLDEAGFERVRERWYRALEAAADERGGVGKRFGDAYEHALRRLEAERRGEEVAEEEPREETDSPKIAAPVGEDPPRVSELSPAPMPPVIPEGMRHFTDLRGTQPAFAAPGGRALPFDPGSRLGATGGQAAQTTNPTPTSASKEEWSLVPEGMRRFTDFRATQPALAAPSGKALPFDSEAIPPSPPKEDWTLVPVGMRHFTDFRSTQPTAEAPRGPILPFQTPPLLSLQQYASLYVELAEDPASEAVILSRYRLDEEQRRRVEAYWQERIKVDPEVRVAWDQACEAFRAWLQKRGVEGA